MRKTLTLRRETLAPLTADDLASVAGAAVAATGGCPWTFHVRECLSLDDCVTTDAS
jgi:hypothetical protein